MLRGSWVWGERSFGQEVGDILYPFIHEDVFGENADIDFSKIDGSLQLTVQAIATMLRNKLAPILFVICNKGYTIERLIHGMEAQYNDVQEFGYKDLPGAFGAKEGQAKSYVVKTKKEFKALLADAEFSDAKSKVLRFVEVYMPWDDAPELLKITSAAAAKGIDG